LALNYIFARFLNISNIIMPFCNRCGNENPNQAQFCVTCGESLTNTTIPVNAKNPNIKFLYIGIIVVISIFLSFGLYYLIQLKKDPTPTPTAGAQPTVENIPVENIPVEEPITPLPPPTKPPVRVTTLPQATTTSGQLPQTTIDNISYAINSYVDADNSNNFSAALDMFEYPITRYYNTYNVSRNQLYDLYQKFSVNKQSYHKLTPHYETSNVYSIGEGYELEIDCTYEWVTFKSPGNLKSKYHKLKFKLNNYYQITSVYEI
jgi:hypothetical protein